MKKTIKPNLAIDREVWGRVKSIATRDAVKTEVVVERFLVEGLKKEGVGQ